MKYIRYRMTLNLILEDKLKEEKEDIEREIPLWERFHDTIKDNQNAITIFNVGCGILFGLYTLQNNQDFIEKKIEKLTERVKEMDLELKNNKIELI